MEANRFLNAVLLLLMILQTSCSVKEDRSTCPVIVKFSDRVNPYGCMSDANLSIDENNVWRSDLSVPMNTLEDKDFEVLIAKGQASVSVIAGASSSMIDGRSVIYGEGLPPDCIFALSEAFRTESWDETYLVRDSLCRQVARTTLKIVFLDDSLLPCSLSIHGNWNGFDRTTLEPLSGMHSFPLNRNAEGSEIHTFLPRQGDTSLTLDFVESGTVRYSFPLGKMIAASGYDWTEKHLEDINIRVDCSVTEFGITINDWVEEGTVEYVM